jgi:hypothetical protein
MQRHALAEQQPPLSSVGAVRLAVQCRTANAVQGNSCELLEAEAFGPLTHV